MLARALRVVRLVVLQVLDERVVSRLGRQRGDPLHGVALHTAGLGRAGERLPGHRRALQVVRVEEAAVEVLGGVRLVVADRPRVALVRLGMVVHRRADELGRVDGEGDGRALLGDLGGHSGEIRDPDGPAGMVGAADHVAHVVEEQRGRADEREVVAAGLDDRVAGLALVQVRVDEVDGDLPAGEPAVLVDVVAKPRTAATGPANSPGCNGLSTSATTAMRIVVAVTPTSVGWGGVVCAGAGTLAAPSTSPTTASSVTSLGVIASPRSLWPFILA